MNILILGGTVFLGRALVGAAMDRGHKLTLFNRGTSNPGLFPEVEQLIGDRQSDLSALNARRWDAVIDTCGYFPRVVRASAELLAGAVDHYTFISTESVYADVSQIGVDESAPVGTLADESVEEITGETYGPLKALCEQAVLSAMPGRALIIRPGLIVGPYDKSDRFTYWPWRIAQGGEVLAPGRPQRGIQFVDVRDLAEWIIRLVETRQTGIFNADGLPDAINMVTLLDACQVAGGGNARLTWVSEDFLLAEQVGMWIEMPLWIPESDPSGAGFFAISVKKALDSGLTYRPLAETVADTLAWAQTRPVDHAWRAGLKPEREAELLAKWRNTRSR